MILPRRRANLLVFSFDEWAGSTKCFFAVVFLRHCLAIDVDFEVLILEMFSFSSVRLVSHFFDIGLYGLAPVPRRLNRMDKALSRSLS